MEKHYNDILVEFSDNIVRFVPNPKFRSFLILATSVEYLLSDVFIFVSHGKYEAHSNSLIVWDPDGFHQMKIEIEVNENMETEHLYHDTIFFLKKFLERKYLDPVDRDYTITVDNDNGIITINGDENTINALIRLFERYDSIKK
jgi:hypothetical protein